MTLDIYADVFNRMNLKAIKQLESLLDEVEVDPGEEVAQDATEKVIYLHNDRLLKARETQVNYGCI